MRSSVLCTVLLMLVPACASDADRGNPVLVSVASSQTEVFEVLAQSLNSSLGPNRIDLNFAGSTTLVNQVNEGAPVSIIVVADRIAADTVEVEVFSQAVIAENRMVAVVHDNFGPIGSFDELANPDIVIAACDPSVPCGRLTQAWLDEQTSDVMIDTQEQNVRQVLARVESGEADVGFVYESDARRLELSDRAKLLDLGGSTATSETWALLLTDEPATRDVFNRLVSFAQAVNGLQP